MKKKPMVTAQQIAAGRSGKSKCNDSAVAQQLTAANAINPTIVEILRNLLSFMIKKVPLGCLQQRLLMLISAIHTNKKRGASLLPVPRH